MARLVLRKYVDREIGVGGYECRGKGESVCRFCKSRKRDRQERGMME